MSETTLVPEGLDVDYWLRELDRVSSCPAPSGKPCEGCQMEEDRAVFIRNALKLQAQLTEVTRERDEARILASLAETFRDDAAKAEAALAPLRAVVDDIRKVCAEAQVDHRKIQREMPWFNTNSETYRVNAARFLVAQQVLDALPADPSAPTPEKE